MQFSVILTSFALAGAFALTDLSVAQVPSREPAAAAAADPLLLEMAQAYKVRDRKRLGALLPQLRGHPLEPWGAYWELSARLHEASPTEMQNFFGRYAGTYQEDRLRAEWLLVLGRNRDWAAFNREYALYRMNDDKSVRCYALMADQVANGVDNSAQVKELWLSLKEADEGCASAAGQLFKDHPASIRHTAWLRARLGMENDRLRVATQAVELIVPNASKTINNIYLNPGKYLSDKLTALQPKTREFVSLALIRHAYLDPDEAAQEINKLRWKAQLTQEERSWVWGVIGKRSAQRMLADAPGYFAQGQTVYMHEDHLAWMTRTALRAGRWNMVLDATSAMAPAQRSDPAWTYWRARALLKQTSSENARALGLQLLQDLGSTRGFYEMLALEELGQRIGVAPAPLPLNASEKDAAAANPGLQRALYAIRLGLRSDGVREWNYTTNLHTRGGMDDRSLLAAADLACQAGVWDRCINTSERTKSFIDLAQRFPMPFRDAVVERSKKIGLDPAYVYGLIRQESRFIMDAKSTVGASGLMQVMPATASWTAKKLGMVGFQPHQITDRDTNIAIGTGYLKMVLDNFGGSMPLAAAAYNAGPGRPQGWRGQTGAPTLEAAIWAENIPFSETRDYVKKVLANTTLYAALITGQPQSLRARLGTVGPRLGAAPVDEAELP